MFGSRQASFRRRFRGRSLHGSICGASTRAFGLLEVGARPSPSAASARASASNIPPRNLPRASERTARIMFRKPSPELFPTSTLPGTFAQTNCGFTCSWAVLRNACQATMLIARVLCAQSPEKMRRFTDSSTVNDSFFSSCWHTAGLGSSCQQIVRRMRTAWHKRKAASVHGP